MCRQDNLYQLSMRRIFCVCVLKFQYIVKNEIGSAVALGSFKAIQQEQQGKTALIFDFVYYNLQS